MDERYEFHPPKCIGTIFHLFVMAALTLGGIWGIWRAVNSSVGPAFLLYLLPFLVAIPLVPFLLYRLNNLQNATYTLERDRLHLRWGLRLESIPMMDVQWIRPASDLGESVRLPRLRWPGALLGTRRLPGGTTTIEFLASQGHGLLVIATPGRLFAISPAQVDEFLQAYQHFTELGSLLPPVRQSVYPTIIVVRMWQNQPARYLILAGVLLMLAVLIWASLATPALERVSLGFGPDGTPRPPIPGIRLMLLPVLNSLIFFVNLFFGLALFRRPEYQPLAYLLWGTSIFVSGLFLAAIYFIL